LARLLSKSFWAKLITGKIRIGESINDIAGSAKGGGPSSTNVAALAIDPRHGSPGYIDRMLKGLTQFKGKARFILSGNDLTAQEFSSLTANDRSWVAACKIHNDGMLVLKAANHTFSTHGWRTQVANQTTMWIKQIDSKSQA